VNCKKLFVLESIRTCDVSRTSGTSDATHLWVQCRRFAMVSTGMVARSRRVFLSLFFTRLGSVFYTARILWNEIVLYVSYNFVALLTTVRKQSNCPTSCVCGDTRCNEAAPTSILSSQLVVASVTSSAPDFVSISGGAPNTLPTPEIQEHPSMLGIVIGCTIVAVILLIAIGGAFFCKKRQRRNDAAARPREQYAALTLQAPCRRLRRCCRCARASRER
jgi:hypothetical protein